MIRRRPALLALLVLALLLPDRSARSEAAEGDARAFVQSVATAYEKLARYRFEGVIQVKATGAELPEAQQMEMLFRYAAIRPSKLHSDARNPYMPSIVVANGESLWVSAPTLHQYSVQKAPAFAPGTKPTAATRAFDPALTMAAGLTTDLQGARWLGADTVQTASGPVSCRRVELTYAPDTTRSNSRALPRVVWIDEARKVVLRDSNTTDMTHPKFGAVRQAQVVRYVVADLESAPPDSLFRFQPPAESKRVRRIGQSASNDRDDAGKPAHGFSLALLDGKGKKVSLAAHKGKVVVLDFWATWCGPCRRWMPIVAKLEKETAGKKVQFYAVNVREPAATVRAYVTEQKVAVPVLLDSDGMVGTAYGASSIPLTVVVGKDGKIVRTLVGVHPEEDLRDALREAGIEGI
jgi:thiol-disulfide isomerase/thioredoxin